MAGMIQWHVVNVAGAEGPLVDQHGRIFMVEPSKGGVLEILPDGGRRDLARYDGVPAGLQLDRDNHIWIADMKKGILKLTLDGVLTPVVDTFEDKPIRGCNDCCFDSHGNLYFTAPAGSSGEKPEGELFCRKADGQVVRLDGGFQFCNGLAVTADDATLIVAETYTKKLWAYDIDKPGQVSNKRVWGVLPGEHKGGPDGLDFDIQGNLLATNWGGYAIEIFDPNGRHIGKIHTPFHAPSNLHFRGPGSRDLLITEHMCNGLWQVEHFCPGQRQYGWR
jgi:gluconolactonase